MQKIQTILFSILASVFFVLPASAKFAQTYDWSLYGIPGANDYLCNLTNPVTCVAGYSNVQQYTAAFTGTITSLSYFGTQNNGPTFTMEVTNLDTTSTTIFYNYNALDGDSTMHVQNATSSVGLAVSEGDQIYIKSYRTGGSPGILGGRTPSTTYKVAGDYDKAGVVSGAPSYGDADAWIAFFYDDGTLTFDYIDFVCEPSISNDFFNFSVSGLLGANFRNEDALYVVWDIKPLDATTGNFPYVEIMPVNWISSNWQDLSAFSVDIRKSVAVDVGEVINARAELWRNGAISVSSSIWEVGINSSTRVTNQCVTSTQEIYREFGEDVEVTTSTIATNIYAPCANIVDPDAPSFLAVYSACSVIQDLKYKGIFGYFTAYSAAWSGMVATTDTSTAFYLISQYAVFQELYDIIQILLWLVFGLYVIQRFKSLQL